MKILQETVQTWGTEYDFSGSVFFASRHDPDSVRLDDVFIKCSIEGFHLLLDFKNEKSRIISPLFVDSSCLVVQMSLDSLADQKTNTVAFSYKIYTEGF